MTNSNSFSSLFDLVESHLSNIANERPSDSLIGSFAIPTFNNIQSGMSVTCLTTSRSSISNVLSYQLSNMFNAEDNKNQQEKLREEMENLKLEEQNMMDLVKAVQRPRQAESRHQEYSSCSSFFGTSLSDYKKFTSQNFINSWESESIVPSLKTEAILPITQDMSYILTQKIKRGKCSPFGKVLTSRLRPVAAPYLREKITSNIVKFDFKTKSPCDIVKERQQKGIHCAGNTYTLYYFSN